MVNIFKSKRGFIICSLILYSIFFYNYSFANNIYISGNKNDKSMKIEFKEDDPLEKGKKFPKTLLPPNKIEKEFYETPLRRFDIIFFLSLPIFIGYQFLIHQILIKTITINGNDGNSFLNQQLIYMLISGVISASAVGYSDYINISKMKQNKKEMSSASYTPLDNQKISFSWNFKF